MFTEQDMREYCEQIIDMERKMSQVYLSLSEQLVRSEYSSVFEQMARDEQQHEKLAGELLSMLVD